MSPASRREFGCGKRMWESKNGQNGRGEDEVCPVSSLVRNSIYYTRCTIGTGGDVLSTGRQACIHSTRKVAGCTSSHVSLHSLHRDMRAWTMFKCELPWEAG
ncbi:hypothetical protein M404DRAFT_999439 [Pisolithus tinctorius Marx 270]|uniref:Uncharacterized protein n=1 Tax=Pisolithus tinctorius Marx 270 TaxID=870435 RepID=A0A0C3PEE9_PISTI|nr:hypothetical protein M404DRAFT_999439 [Pisolithus tinctorius Marx 270]